MLSGGEKARLALAKFMLTPGTLLVLDEPTNHLDIPSKEMLEDALVSFPGAVISVSHDRYFLRKIATRIIAVGSDRPCQGMKQCAGTSSVCFCVAWFKRIKITPLILVKYQVSCIQVHLGSYIEQASCCSPKRFAFAQRYQCMHGGLPSEKPISYTLQMRRNKSTVNKHH